MKFSCHTILVKDYPSPSEYLAFNTRTQALVKIHQGLKDAIDHFDAPDYLSQKVHYADDLVQLQHMGIIVNDDHEDRVKLRSFLNQLKFSTNKASFPVTILTTYACNLKCTYCFQESSRTNVKMDEETSDRTMDWIKAKLEKDRYEQLFVNFYGGEPLVNRPILERIAGHLKPWCESRGIRFKFMMQTNGYLMTPDCIDRCLNLGLVQVRISVDGVGEVHDRHRPLRNGGGTFDTIVKNIVACADKVPIGISTSYDQGNIKAIEDLIHYFDEIGILHKLGRFIFSPVHATLGPQGQPEKIIGSECMCNYEDDKLIETNQKIRALMEKNKLPTKSGLSTSICPVTRDHAGVTIDQHGRIYKCNSMLGHPEFAIGDVRENEYNEVHKAFVGLDVWQQCPTDCTYMPMCSGGCRLSSYLKNQNFQTPTCHKAYLNKMTPEFIKQDYEALMAEK